MAILGKETTIFKDIPQAQVMRIIEKALLSKGIIVDIKAKGEK